MEVEVGIRRAAALERLMGSLTGFGLSAAAKLRAAAVAIGVDASAVIVQLLADANKRR